MPKAKVIVTVPQLNRIQFGVASTPQFTPISNLAIDGTANPGNMLQPGSTADAVKVRQRRKIKRIEYTFKSDLANEKLTVVGFAFKPNGAGALFGDDDLEVEKMDGPSIVVVNHFNNSNAAGGVRIGFYVVIQNQAGALGVIDPAIENMD